MIRVGNLLLLICIIFSCSSSKSGRLNEMSSRKIFSNRTSNQSDEFQRLINSANVVILSFEQGKKYYLEDIEIEDKDSVILFGNGATLLPSSDSISSILSFRECKFIRISNLKIDGRSGLTRSLDYLLKIESKFIRGNKVRLDSLNIRNGDEGGVLIHNPNYKLNAGGVDSIFVTNSYITNPGRHSCFNIRGNNGYALVENCFGSDPEGRQRKGAIFGFSSTVPNEKNYISHVEVLNCTADTHNRAGLFAQKVKNLHVNGFTSINGGIVPFLLNGKLKGINGIKLDDLGAGSKALLENINVNFQNTDIKYRIGLALEQSQGKSVTHSVTLRNFKFTNAGVRLVASGRNTIENGEILDHFIVIKSDSNTISNMAIINNTNGNAIRLLGKSNRVDNCRFYKGNIKVFEKSKNNYLTKNHFFNLKQTPAVVLEKSFNGRIYYESSTLHNTRFDFNRQYSEIISNGNYKAK